MAFGGVMELLHSFSFLLWCLFMVCVDLFRFWVHCVLGFGLVWVCFVRTCA